MIMMKLSSNNCIDVNETCVLNRLLYSYGQFIVTVINIVIVTIFNIYVITMAPITIIIFGVVAVISIIIMIIIIIIMSTF